MIQNQRLVKYMSGTIAKKNETRIWRCATKMFWCPLPLKPTPFVVMAINSQLPQQMFQKVVLDEA
jgi:hypothetical protein